MIRISVLEIYQKKVYIRVTEFVFRIFTILISILMLLMFGKTAVLKVLENSKKNVLLEFHWSNSNCPLHGKLSYVNLTLLQMFPVSVLRISKMLWKRLLWINFLLKQQGKFLYSTTLPKTLLRALLCSEK